jgi:alpha-tubulin suppressor-like RCC1 family protein
MREFLLFTVAAAVTLACGTDSVTEPQVDYTLSLTPATLTITQGATGTINVGIDRANFTDAVTLSLGNAPVGITASFQPAASTGTSVTLTLSVGPAVTPGDYHLTVSGTASAGNRSTPFDVTVNSNPAVKGAMISAGYGYSCLLDAAGHAYCWGVSAFDGTRTQRLTPTPVAGGITFASLSAGSHLCGVTATHDAYCWGYNLYGQLGDGTTTDKLEPTPVVGGLSFASISAGVLHTCGVTASGAAYCWGVNQSGSLGDGTTTDRIVPTPVAGGLTFKQISVGFYYTCGVTTAGDAYCWGGNRYFNYTNRPIPIDLNIKFALVSAGWTHTCGLATNGTVYCWSNNEVGQLGDGTLTSRQNLIPVAGGLTFTTVSTGNDAYSCGVATGGSAYCWGWNAYGQLGDGTTNNRLVPTLVSGGLTFVSVDASTTLDGAHTCGLTTSGAVYCWELNDHGQLGDGTTNQQLVPTSVKFP